jgi:hypothetical protein
MKSHKTNKAKRTVRSCRNHGACEWCNGNRTIHTKRQKSAVLDELKQWKRGTNND